jgi:hypothetical protein
MVQRRKVLKAGNWYRGMTGERIKFRDRFGKLNYSSQGTYFTSSKLRFTKSLTSDGREGNNKRADLRIFDCPEGNQ